MGKWLQFSLFFSSKALTSSLWPTVNFLASILVMQCMCSGCAKVLRFQTNRCPICRQSVERLLEIKVSNGTNEWKDQLLLPCCEIFLHSSFCFSFSQFEMPSCLRYDLIELRYAASWFLVSAQRHFLYHTFKF